VHKSRRIEEERVGNICVLWRSPMCFSDWRIRLDSIRDISLYSPTSFSDWRISLDSIWDISLYSAKSYIFPTILRFSETRISNDNCVCVCNQKKYFLWDLRARFYGQLCVLGNITIRYIFNAPTYEDKIYYVNKNALFFVRNLRTLTRHLTIKLLIFDFSYFGF